jgi:hypothetical protein
MRRQNARLLARFPPARTALIKQAVKRAWGTVMRLLIKVSATIKWSAGYNRWAHWRVSASDAGQSIA